MSGGVAAIGFSILVLGLIFALPLFFAGYEPRVNWNAELVETMFTIQSHIVAPATCFHDCNCHKSCTSSKSSSCTTKCSRCPYLCFSKSYVKSYVVETNSIMGISKNMQYTTTIYVGTSASLAWAYADLSCWFPIGKRYKGYYRASMPWVSVDTPYHDITFLVFAIIFAIVALGGLGVCVVAGIAYVCDQ